VCSSPDVWGFEHLDPFFKNLLVRTTTTDLLYQFDARSLRKSFQAVCVKVGLGVKTGPEDWRYKGLLIHDFRRSGVRNLIRSRVPRRIAMKISGHLTESTFERHNVVDSTDLHEAMAKVEKHFDGSLDAN
jgi:hypothetical protein